MKLTKLDLVTLEVLVKPYLRVLLTERRNGGSVLKIIGNNFVNIYILFRTFELMSELFLLSLLSSRGRISLSFCFDPSNCKPRIAVRKVSDAQITSNF